MYETLSKEDILSKFAIADVKATQQAYNEAIDLYKDIIENTDNYSQLVNAYNKIGNIYYKINDFDNAIWAFENVLNFCTNIANIYNMLGYLYFHKDIDKSIKYYLKEMELKPDIKIFILLTQIMIKSAEYSQKDLKNIFEKYVDILRPSILKGVEPYQYSNKFFDKYKKLKIGYLSSSFYYNSMMSYVLPIIENHNLNEFDITLYSCSNIKDSVTQRLTETGVEYKNCYGLTNKEIAKKIHDDNVDILVDLDGYTHSKQTIWTLLYKPAPIIIQYSNSSGTYGMKEIDYILTDKFTVSGREEKYYTEKPIHIKSGMNKFTLPIKEQQLPQITPLPFEQNEYITFGCFNSLSKINIFTLNLWSKVLKAVLTSKILICKPQMEEKDITRLQKIFEENKIKPERIIFDKQFDLNSPMSNYLKCDIALDTTPFSDITTSIEQAFMGVPTLTLYKDTFSSKGTARINKIIGLKDFIAKNEEDFVNKAVKVSHNIEKLKFYRRNLPTIVEKSSLCNDFKDFTQQIENEYKTVWKKFCK